MQTSRGYVVLYGSNSDVFSDDIQLDIIQFVEYLYQIVWCYLAYRQSVMHRKPT